MTFNVKLAKKVRKMIADEPRRLYMKVWGVKLGSPRFSTPHHIAKNPPPCGTVACLAGHIELASTPKRKWNKLFTKDGVFVNQSGIMERAAMRIGLPATEVPFLELDWNAKQVLRWLDTKIKEAEQR